ncbi:pre-mRNA-splicing factor 8 [Ceratobasidium sp. 370]|nr:pre-mRNA-splicing factor 8 [Ceratobasidium sp. 370]
MPPLPGTLPGATIVLTRDLGSGKEDCPTLFFRILHSEYMPSHGHGDCSGTEGLPIPVRAVVNRLVAGFPTNDESVLEDMTSMTQYTVTPTTPANPAPHVFDEPVHHSNWLSIWLTLRSEEHDEAHSLNVFVVANLYHLNRALFIIRQQLRTEYKVAFPHLYDPLPCAVPVTPPHELKVIYIRAHDLELLAAYSLTVANDFVFPTPCGSEAFKLGDHAVTHGT